MGHWGLLGGVGDCFKGIRRHQGYRGCQGCIGGLTGTRYSGARRGIGASVGIRGS